MEHFLLAKQLLASPLAARGVLTSDKKNWAANIRCK
jgi:hypothetical protein